MQDFGRTFLVMQDKGSPQEKPEGHVACQPVCDAGSILLPFSALVMQDLGAAGRVYGVMQGQIPFLWRASSVCDAGSIFMVYLTCRF
jgi:hypothetical protein